MIYIYIYIYIYVCVCVCVCVCARAHVCVYCVCVCVCVCIYIYIYIYNSLMNGILYLYGSKYSTLIFMTVLILAYEKISSHITAVTLS